MIYATGDTHGHFLRFDRKYFPEQKGMGRRDYVIICGDFGGVWDNSEEEGKKLDWLNKLPFTMLFVDGNHENFDRLSAFPEEDWHGGKVHRIRNNVLHLMRGQVFILDGYTFFTMGGASSHDIEGGILDINDADFESKALELDTRRLHYRVNHVSWWAEELPSDKEYAEARSNLERVGWQVDYVITHCAPSSIADILGEGGYIHDHLNDFLEEVNQKMTFHYWLFGHYHDNRNIGEQHVLLWEQLVRIN